MKAGCHWKLREIHPALPCKHSYRQIGSDLGAEIILHKKLPLGSGMGSSAASSVAALVAINHLYDNPFTREQLLPFAMEAERIACGSAHADNVAPSLLGGFVLIRGYDPLDVTKIPTPPSLYCTLVHPHIELKTEDSRRVLKSSIPDERCYYTMGEYRRPGGRSYET